MRNLVMALLAAAALAIAVPANAQSVGGGGGQWYPGWGGYGYGGYGYGGYGYGGYGYGYPGVEVYVTVPESAALPELGRTYRHHRWLWRLGWRLRLRLSALVSSTDASCSLAASFVWSIQGSSADHLSVPQGGDVLRQGACTREDEGGPDVGDAHFDISAMRFL
jgi:hypothetical protein